MNNYRVEYARSVECSYWNKSEGLQAESEPNFRDLPKKFWPDLSKIYTKASELGIKYIWHFYEPYVEITWLSDDPVISEKLVEYIKLIIDYDDLVIRRPADGVFADWYCTSEREREFGAKRHALCAEWVKLYNEYKDAVDNGKGLEYQVARTIHTLSNPLGLNYQDEGRFCFRRGIAAFLYRYFSYNTSQFICKKILRFKG